MRRSASDAVSNWGGGGTSASSPEAGRVGLAAGRGGGSGGTAGGRSDGSDGMGEGGAAGCSESGVHHTFDGGNDRTAASSDSALAVRVLRESGQAFRRQLPGLRDGVDEYQDVNSREGAAAAVASASALVR